MINSHTSLNSVVNTLANLVRSIHLKRVLAGLERDPKLNFWRLMQGNLLDIAVLDWCKLFGSDDQEHQPVHWKNIISDREEFRSGLLRQLGISESQWKDYWQEMKLYRDTHVAHSDFRKPDVIAYPKLELALQSGYFYYDHLLRALQEDGAHKYPTDIREYGRRFIEQSKMIAERAVAATRDLEEQVF
jgi:hypothetical protein